MARDENDRPYEDGQGRSLNPDLAGDVLSPRWSTEDTDEQPAIQVSGNETYILPDKGADPQREGVRDVLDPPAPYDVLGGGQDVLGGPSGAHDVLGAPSGAHDVLGGTSGAHDVLGGGHDTSYQDGRGYQDDRTYQDDPAYQDDRAYDGLYRDERAPQDERAQGRYTDDSGAFPVENEPGYLPLDRGYDQGFEDDDQPRRGFLGSGWSDDSDDDYHARGEREVRRRTRTLLVAAAAVVVLGVGVGWVLTGTSSDDCAGGRCAGAGQVNAPAESALPDDEPVEEEEAEPEPTESADQEEQAPTGRQGNDDAGTPAEQPRSTVPTQTQQNTRPTHEPTTRPRATRTAEPTQDTEEEQVRVPANREGGNNGGIDRGGRTTDQTDSRDDAPRSDSGSGQDDEAQPPTEVNEQPEQPQQEEDKGNGGLLGILFPWL